MALNSATVLFNRIGERIDAAVTSRCRTWWCSPRSVVDFSLRFPLYASISGRFDAKNLLDDKRRVLQRTSLPVISEVRCAAIRSDLPPLTVRLTTTSAP